MHADLDVLTFPLALLSELLRWNVAYCNKEFFAIRRCEFIGFYVLIDDSTDFVVL